MKLKLNSSPHIHSGNATARIMRDVLIALLPAVLAGMLRYGLRALAVMLVCVLSALVGEAVFRKFTRQHCTLPDNSAAVTGLLTAMTLPASVPYWIAAIGSLFAVIVAKGICGGLGQNSFNPALAARAFLLLFWPAYLTRYPSAGTSLPLFGSVDMVSSATPLHEMQKPALPGTPLWDMFIGNIDGCIGEISALALLIGGVYLIVRKVIRPHIPLAYLGTVALLTFLFHRGQNPLLWMLYSLFGGGVMLGAIFMATDYSSSPVTPRGQLLYGVGCGALTVLFRYVGLFPEGFTYAILIMNAATWIIDEKIAPRRFGIQKGAAQ